MIALVDVDNTLWNFSKALHDKINDYYPNRSVPSQFKFWDEPFNYFTKQEFYDMVDEIHLEQCNYEPFSEAKQLLIELLNKDYYIYIASNRHPRHKKELERWFYKYKLPYSSIFCDKDKRVLFGQYDFGLVIDDNPEVQDEAKSNNIKVISLYYEYNKNNCKTFNSLDELIINL